MKRPFRVLLLGVSCTVALAVGLAPAQEASEPEGLSFGHPSVVSVNWWGFSDRRIWLPGGGLVTREYEPKPVYKRLRQLIHDEWKTCAELTTSPDGSAKFRGFLGRYTVTIKSGKHKAQTFEATLRKEGDNNRVFTLGK